MSNPAAPACDPETKPTRLRNFLGPIVTILIAALSAGAVALIAYGGILERLKVVEGQPTVDVAEERRHNEIDAKADRCCQATTVNKEAVEKLETKIDGLAAEQRATAKAVGALTAEVRAVLRADRRRGSP